MINFDELGLDQSLLKAVSDLGYTEPTPVQAEIIPALLSENQDCVALAQTGTGKTAAFGLPLLQSINPMSREIQGLIIAPTRELCMQIEKDMLDMSKYANVNIVSVYGGADARGQIRQIKNGAQIICATPGRLLDFAQRNVINLESIEKVILDEADEMLNMGFLDDIKYVLDNTPNRDSLWLFSATMPKEIHKIAKKHMMDPLEVAMSTVNSTNKNINHQFLVTNNRNKMENLRRVLDYNPDMYAVIFTRTKRDAKEVAEKLLKVGYSTNALHGDLEQKQRDVVMNRFREGTVKVLVATDVAARGIDVTGITHVINYELPDDPEVYTHRSGRTGRAGNTGIALSLVSDRDIRKVRQIERVCKTGFERVEAPSPENILDKKIQHYTEKVASHKSDQSVLERNRERILSAFTHLERDEILLNLMSYIMKDDLGKYTHAKDLKENNVWEGKKGNGKQTAIFINMGTKDGLNQSSFRQWICDNTGIPAEAITRIFMKDVVSFFDVETNVADHVIKTLNGQREGNRKLRLDISERPARSSSGRAKSYKKNGGYKGGKKAFKPRKKSYSK